MVGPSEFSGKTNLKVRNANRTCFSVGCYLLLTNNEQFQADDSEKMNFMISKKKVQRLPNVDCFGHTTSL